MPDFKKMGRVTFTKTTTKTYNILQVALDFLAFNKSYRRIRGNSRYPGFECYQCRRHFQDGEKISLALTDKGNKVLCHDCGMEIKAKLEE